MVVAVVVFECCLVVKGSTAVAGFTVTVTVTVFVFDAVDIALVDREPWWRFFKYERDESAMLLLRVLAEKLSLLSQSQSQSQLLLLLLLQLLIDRL
jgi:hypothetical protein